MSKTPIPGPRRLAQDGYRPAPAPLTLPKKVQGGYQAPSGGQRPNLPTVGSGVRTPSNPPPKK